MAEVSVIIAARNAGRTIDAALASVFAQTVGDLEVIVIDAGSTDDTAARLNAFGSRIVGCHQPQQSIVSAVSAGLQLARGRILMLLDPADLWMPRKLERQLTYFERFPGTAFLHGAVLSSSSPESTLLDAEDATRLSAGLAPPASAGGSTAEAEVRLSTVAVRRDALDAIGPIRTDGDLSDAIADLRLRCAASFDVGRLDVPTAVVRASEESAAEPTTEARVKNLLQDTRFRRARMALTGAIHQLDDAVSSRHRGPLRVLFEAASPMSLAVFGPVFHQLARDPRLEFWFTSCDRSWDGAAIFRSAEVSDRIVRPEQVRWAKFDAYINTDFWDMTWLRRRTRRIHFFHGVAGKYGLDAPVRIAPIVATFDRLMFPNRDRLRRYADAGLIDADSPQAALIGYPKVDCLVDGSLDRVSTLARLGLDADRPTVLYAPTWSPYSSINLIGNEVIAGLGRLGLNVIVKLHDRSYDTTARGSGGVDWRQRLPGLCERHGARLVLDADASPYLHAADLLVTDHSSVGFEFMLLDRPLVVLDSPDLVSHARVSADKVAKLHSAAFVVADASSLGRTVLEGLASPRAHQTVRRSIADELFYCPGSATTRAAQCIYDLLSLPLPEASLDLDSVRTLHALAPLARSL